MNAAEIYLTLLGRPCQDAEELCYQLKGREFSNEGKENFRKKVLTIMDKKLCGSYLIQDLYSKLQVTFIYGALNQKLKVWDIMKAEEKRD